MTDANTRVKIMLGDLIIQQANLTAALEERDAKIAELEAQITKLNAPPAAD